MKDADIFWQKINQFNNQQGVLNRDLDQQIYQYQEVIEELLVNREKTVALIGNIDKNSPIPPADLDDLNLRMQTALCGATYRVCGGGGGKETRSSRLYFYC